MYKNYKVVCVTPAGRRRYMRLLAPYILNSKIVDEYQVWVNTRDTGDVAHLRNLAEVDKRIRLIEATEVPPGGNQAIGQFVRNCIDRKTIYVRFDDDVVFISDEMFAEFLEFRIKNPRYFIVSPLVVNNALCTYILQSRGLLNELKGFGNATPNCLDRLGWASHEFARQLHTLFLEKAEGGSLGDWRFDRQEVSVWRYSVNCICWLGEEFAQFGGHVPLDSDEEEWLSAIKPTSIGRTNCIFGGAIVGHFAFGPQRHYLDATDLYGRYADLCVRKLGPNAAHLSGMGVEGSPLDGESRRAAHREWVGEVLMDRIREKRHWQFGRSDGAVISTALQLTDEGRIIGHFHGNESGWEFRDGALCFISAEGRVSTRFDSLAEESGGRLCIYGQYLLDNVEFAHVLREVLPSDDARPAS